jgi:DNA polymerase-1
VDKIIVTADLFDSSIKSLAESDTLFLDIESNGFLFNRNTLCGVGISTATSEAMYFPFRHADHPEPLDNLSADHLATLLSTINKAKVLVGYNIKFDLKFLEFENPNLLTMEDKVLIDVLVMVRLTEKAKHERLDLTHTIAREFGESAAEYDKSCKEIMRKNKWNKDFSLAPISLLGFYCCDDVLWTRKLFFSRKSEIEATQQTQIWEQSIKLTSVLYQMEYRGVKIDSEYASDGAKRITARQEAVLKRIYDIAGQEFNVSSNPQLGKVFESLGIQSPEVTDKGNPSWGEKSLVKIDHELAGRVREYRSLGKMLNTYIEPFSSTDVLHCTYCNWGTVTGRLSSRSPNLQNIPRGIINTVEQNLNEEETKALQGRLEAIIKANKGRISLDNQDISAWAFVGGESLVEGDPTKFSIRKTFIPREGYTLYGLDYKQMEVWVFLSYFMSTEELAALKEQGVDLHDNSAKAAFHVDETHEEWKFYRQAAKNLSFGILYGLGLANLANSLDCTIPEAKTYKNNFLDGLPGSKEFIKNVVKKITLTGMVQNRYGRKYWIPKDFAYAGINYLVQGTSADIMSERMIAVHEYLKDKKSSLIMQVHDEILLEVATGEEYIVDSVKDLMEENSLGISLLVDVEIHDPSWAHVRDVSKVDEEQEPEPNVQELLEEIQKLNVDIDYWKAKYEYVEELLGSVGGTDDWVYEDRFARA